MHGGATPRSKAAAKRRVREAKVQAALNTYGLPRDVDPHTALLEELHRSAGHVAWLGAQVAALKRGEVVWGLTRRKSGGDDRGVTHEAGVNTWVQLYSSERKHLISVAKSCVDAGIEERRVRLAESQGEQLAAVLRGVLARLELTPEQLELVPVVVPEEFRRLTQPEGSDSPPQGAR